MLPGRTQKPSTSPSPDLAKWGDSLAARPPGRNDSSVGWPLWVKMYVHVFECTPMLVFVFHVAKSCLSRWLTVLLKMASRKRVMNMFVLM